MMKLIEANLYYLQQAAELVETLEDRSYVCSEPMFYNSSIGGHVRHCLEHYEALTKGVFAGKIDYDARCRDVLVENKTEAAGERIKSITDSLKALNDHHSSQNVQVKMDCGGLEPCNDPSSQWQASTLGRELQFLVSHSVHHFAMIRGICQCAGVELDENFGIAPSTMRYRETLNAVPVSS